MRFCQVVDLHVQSVTVPFETGSDPPTGRLTTSDSVNSRREIRVAFHSIAAFRTAVNDSPRGRLCRRHTRPHSAGAKCAWARIF